MRRLRRLRRPTDLKATFILAVVAFGGVLSITFAVVSSYLVVHDLREQFNRRGALLSDNLAGEAAQFLAISDPTERRLSLLLLTHRATIGDVAYAQVVEDGMTVSESFQSDDVVLSPLAQPSSLPTTREIENGAGRYLDFVRPLPNSEGRSYIRLGMNLDVIRERMWRTVPLLGGLSLLFTCIGVVVAFGLYSVLLKPLDELVRSIRRLAKGDYHVRTRISGYREFKEISSAFNSMAEEITRRTKTLHRRNDDLQQANRAKSEFLAMIGHELKAPLHGILGYCQYLLEEIDGPLRREQKSDVRAVLAAGSHLLSLIQNILRFNALGTESLHLTQVSLEDLLEQAVNHVRPIAQKKGLPVRLDPHDLGSIRVDETKFKQVLINLLHNAVKYTREGEVRVSARKETEGVCVTVFDTGPGIPEGEQQRVFEPFETIKRDEVNEMKGLGLGLAIVARYADAHHGWVKLSSNEGEGSRFTVFVPEIQPFRSSTAESGASPEGDRFARDGGQGGRPA